MTSNINIPPTPAFVNSKLITSDMDGYIACELFACRLSLNIAPTFHIMLESGVMYHNLPISAFKWDKNASDFDGKGLDELQRNLSWWNSQGNTGECVEYAYIRNCEADFKSRNGNTYRGLYLFTIEEIHNSNMPLGYAGDISAKCHHVLKLENGYFGISPNTFLRWDCGDNFVDWNVGIPKLKANNIRISSEFKNK